jgi:hypothetical protein
MNVPDDVLKELLREQSKEVFDSSDGLGGEITPSQVSEIFLSDRLEEMSFVVRLLGYQPSLLRVQ